MMRYFRNALLLLLITTDVHAAALVKKFPTDTPVLVSTASDITAAEGLIPEYATDPVSPVAQQAWILRSGSGGGIPDGTPIGILLCNTYTGNSGTAYTYQFSYETNEGTIKRATIN